ncbi:hypothetical protein ACNI3T_13710 [Christiangramia sp. ASW11-125]|uniref:hypothetical protein n=1 Tax=Christiangramia sp. ASW11-125 TaxID=3400701 RepID=UPI003AACFDBB
MRKLNYILLIILITSCITKKEKSTVTLNGQKIQIELIDLDKDLDFTGYGATKKDGELESLAYYKNGEIIDTLYSFHKNGEIKEKGLVKDNYKFGWWSEYDSKGRKVSETEYRTEKDQLYKNQVYYYDSNGNVKIEPSSYYELDIPDTIKIGRNLARVKNYETSFNDRESNLLTVIVDNQYSDSIIKKDSFSDGTMKPFFGIYGYKEGNQIVKGIIEEKIISEIDRKGDSSTFSLEMHHKYFEKEVYVWNKQKYSKSGLRISKQMEVEYENN